MINVKKKIELFQSMKINWIIRDNNKLLPVSNKYLRYIEE